MIKEFPKALVPWCQRAICFSLMLSFFLSFYHFCSKLNFPGSFHCDKAIWSQPWDQNLNLLQLSTWTNYPFSVSNSSHKTVLSVPLGLLPVAISTFSSTPKLSLFSGSTGSPFPFFNFLKRSCPFVLPWPFQSPSPSRIFTVYAWPLLTSPST